MAPRIPPIAEHLEENARPRFAERAETRRRREPMRSAGVIALLTTGSRCLGLVRDLVFAHFFSTTQLMSAFRIAFMVPNLARRLFGEGALSAAMVPALTTAIRDRGLDEARRLFGSLLKILTGLLVIAVSVAELLAVLGRVYQGNIFWRLTNWTLPYMLLVCLVAAGSGALHVRDHFAIPAAAPSVLNLAMIAAILGGHFGWGLVDDRLMVAVCVAVLASGIVQLILTAAALKRTDFFPCLSGGWRHPALTDVTRVMVPMVLGLSVVQVNALLDHLIAFSFIERDGERCGPAVLAYAQNLYQLPLGVFGLSIATALYPHLAAHAAKHDRQAVAGELVRGLGTALFIALPACAGLMLIAEPLVTALLERGAFNRDDTVHVSRTLVLYSLGIPAYFVQHLLVRCFYVLHDSRTPARLATRIVGLNLVLNLILVHSLEERGLALSTSICAVVQVWWTGRLLRDRLPELPWRQVWNEARPMMVAAGIMAIVLGAGPQVVPWNLDVHRIVRLTVLVVVGTVTYFGAAWFLGIPELKKLMGRTGIGRRV